MNRDQFLQSLLQLISANASPGGFLAAKLGVILRRMYGYAPWYAVGFQGLKEALDELKMRGYIQTGPDQKGGFAVWLSSPSERPIPNLVTERAGSDLPYRKLRKHVWNAFIAEMPQGLRFMQVGTGTVIVGQTMPPGPVTEWKQIQPIQRHVQQQWAREFLQERHLDGDGGMLAALEAERWYLDFSWELKARSPVLVSAWNWHRTQKTLREVARWCSESGVPETLAFETLAAENLSTGIGSRAEQSPATSSPAREAPIPQLGAGCSDDLRDRIMKTISCMPTAELLELRLPVKYLLTLWPPSDAPSSSQDANH